MFPFNQNCNLYVCIFPYAKSKQILVTFLTSIKFKNSTGSGLVYCLFVCSSDWVFIQLMFWIGKKATFPVLFSRFCQVLSCLHSSPSFSYVFSQHISTGLCTINKYHTSTTTYPFSFVCWGTGWFFNSEKFYVDS